MHQEAQTAKSLNRHNKSFAEVWGALARNLRVLPGFCFVGLAVSKFELVVLFQDI
jgi:hypothetical protein